MSPLTMTSAEREQFLADVHVGVLAIESGDGPPTVAPVWYQYEPGGDVLISTGDGSTKHRLLAAAGRASLCVQREELPYAYVTVDGPVTIAETSDEFRLGLAARYLGDEAAKQYLESVVDQVEVQVRLSPQRWRTTDYRKLGSTA
jgi:PPOX class probable F420-dependent enzyme